MPPPKPASPGPARKTTEQRERNRGGGTGGGGGFAGRKMDAFYAVFLGMHVLVMIFIDLPPLYPISLTPRFITDLRAWYAGTYSDRFFGADAPAWFAVYRWLEAGWHFPVCVWGLRGLWVDHPHIPLHLLPFALQTSITTLTCIAEMLSWPLSAAQKGALAWLYVPYLCVALVMSLDMFFRLKRRLR